MLLRLAFIGSTFEENHPSEDSGKRQDGDENGAQRRKITDQHGSSAAQESQQVHADNSAAMTEAEIGKTVSGMVFARSGKREKTAARARNSDQSGVEDGDSQNQKGNQPGGNMVAVSEAQLQSEGGHQESEEHGAAIAHENFGRLEIPTKKTGRRAEDGGRERGDESLAIQIGEQCEENRGGGRNAGAQTVHVVEDAEGGGDADDEEDCEKSVKDVAGAAAEKDFKNLRVNASRKQNTCGERHAEEKFDLMMKQATIIENADGGHDGRAAQDSHDLLACFSAKGEKNREDHGPIHGQATEERNRSKMNLARTGKIDHSNAQGERAHGYRQHQGCE